MSDFISNRPDGKSDLYTASQETPPKDNTSASSGAVHDANAPLDDMSAAPSSQISSPSWNDIPYTYTEAQTPPHKEATPNPLATASLVLGIVTWAGLILCCGCFSPITAILAIIFAAISRENKKMTGQGIAGLVLGIVFLSLLLLLLIDIILGGLYVSSVIETEETIVSLLRHLQY